MSLMREFQATGVCFVRHAGPRRTWTSTSSTTMCLFFEIFLNIEVNGRVDL